MVYKQEQNQTASPRLNNLTYEQANVLTNAVKLWIEYFFWMRSLIEYTINEPERLPFIARKLYDDVIPKFYSIFEFFYGTPNAKTFISLFTNFTTGIWGLTTALKSNNSEEINKQTVQLYQSADNLANFLGQINVYYSADQWKNYPYQVIRLDIDEATSVISKDYEKEVDISSRAEDLIMLMGDYMARGLMGGANPAAQNPPAKKEQNQPVTPGSNCYTFEQMNVIMNSVKLWLEYAFWLRTLIDSTINNPERQSFAANKLFNGLIPEYYSLFEFYYGAELAQTFVTLLTNFTSGVWNLVTALKNNNQEEVNTNAAQVYRSADEMANFLGKINVNYSADQWRNYFYQAIKFAFDETVANINKDYGKEVEVSDSLVNLVILMGNYMARGILAGSYPASQTPPTR